LSSSYWHTAESTTIVPGTRVLLFHWFVSCGQRLAPVAASYGTTRRSLTARADGAYYCLRPAAGVRPSK
jgi:hypothetical protein